MKAKPSVDVETVPALLEQRSQIMTKIEGLKAELKEAITQIDHVEATVRRKRCDSRIK